MSESFKGVVNIDIKDSTPDWAPYTQPIAPPGAPNVLYVVLDDVGFSAMEPYGGFIETPNIKRIADRGLKYTSFHTTALCSPTRSCLHDRPQPHDERHGVHHRGHLRLPERERPHPIRVREPGGGAERPRLEHVRDRQVASDRRGRDEPRVLEAAVAARPRLRALLRLPRRETNQWYPDLVYDNHPVTQPATPEQGYHLTVDLTDKAIEFIQDAKAIAPDKPFFLYYCPGAAHAPHHAPKEWADKYKGRFDMGYEAYREEVFANQKKLGIVADDAELSPINPYVDTTSADGQAVAAVRPGPPVGLALGRREAAVLRAWPRCTPAS